MRLWRNYFTFYVYPTSLSSPHSSQPACLNRRNSRNHFALDSKYVRIIQFSWTKTDLYMILLFDISEKSKIALQAKKRLRSFEYIFVIFSLYFQCFQKFKIYFFCYKLFVSLRVFTYIKKTLILFLPLFNTSSVPKC